jgi:hypothetical protein
MNSKLTSSRNITYSDLMAVPYLRRLGTGLSQRRLGFTLGVSSGGICVGHSGTGTGFSLSSSVFPVNIIPP